jgi:Flp pilus assembly protein TadG
MAGQGIGSEGGQSSLELALVLPAMISVVVFMLGWSVAATRHMLLHFGVQMAVRKAAASSERGAADAAEATVRKVAGIAWNTQLLAPHPQLPVKIEIHDGVARVEAGLLDRTPYFRTSNVHWRLPVEQEAGN